MSLVEKRKVYLNKEFTCKVPNGFILDVDLVLEKKQEIDSNFLKAFNSGQVGVPDPDAKVVSHGFTAEGKEFFRVRLFFDEKFYPLTSTIRISLRSINQSKTTNFNLFTFNFGDFWMKAFKWAAITAILTIATGIFLYIDKKYNDGKVLSFWYKISAFAVVDAIENTDNRIFTNNHALYSSEEFIDLEKAIGKKEVSLKDKYWFVGDGLFVLRELIKTDSGDPVIMPFYDAKEICEKLGGRIPYEEELDIAIGGSIFTKFPDLVKPIKSDNGIPEWTATKVGGDYYRIYMKKATLPPMFSVKTSKGFIGEEDDTLAAFRCVIKEDEFL